MRRIPGNHGVEQNYGTPLPDTTEVPRQPVVGDDARDVWQASSSRSASPPVPLEAGASGSKQSEEALTSAVQRVVERFHCARGTLWGKDMWTDALKDMLASVPAETRDAIHECIFAPIQFAESPREYMSAFTAMRNLGEKRAEIIETLGRYCTDDMPTYCKLEMLEILARNPQVPINMFELLQKLNVNTKQEASYCQIFSTLINCRCDRNQLVDDCAQLLAGYPDGLMKTAPAHLDPNGVNLGTVESMICL